MNDYSKNSCSLLFRKKKFLKLCFPPTLTLRKADRNSKKQAFLFHSHAITGRQSVHNIALQYYSLQDMEVFNLVRLRGKSYLIQSQKGLVVVTLHSKPMPGFTSSYAFSRDIPCKICIIPERQY